MVHGFCNVCVDLKKCPTCGETVESFQHVGVRGKNQKSGIWHWAKPCGHRYIPASVSTKQGVQAVYNGGPLWQANYKWQNILWGSFWQSDNINLIQKMVQDIVTDNSYWGGLQEYNIPQTPNTSNIIILPFSQANISTIIILEDPPSTIDDSQIPNYIRNWIKAGLIPDLKGQGAYNIFFPPNVTVTLQGATSCVEFCDYHNYDGTDIFYTVEPYPCQQGCNECTQNTWDTLSQGLSEELVELATDMNPGTGWVIGSEELCDFCDAQFVCNQISTGEYVNAWYSNKMGKCWGKATQPPPPQTVCLDDFLQLIADIETGNIQQALNDLVSLLQCLSTQGLSSRLILEALLRKEIDKIKHK